jgi:hypothetical protein
LRLAEKVYSLLYSFRLALNIPIEAVTRNNSPLLTNSFDNPIRCVLTCKKQSTLKKATKRKTFIGNAK